MRENLFVNSSTSEYVSSSNIMKMKEEMKNSKATKLHHEKQLQRASENEDDATTIFIMFSGIR
ncbi:hypothetical protein T4B_12907 [Trichinella pseudospiralis]|uniref:Uncharacterized protein n=1 Tax=Trichinella pseudospiralis TaxID=6337 RepID=A0A0V1JRZ1_TRIPS|nr:hypothetical protein T4A_11057 [Trichinella pseudospiralis]KRZ31827.1 hypothetical protein T4B_12907 [Trichinella pseudospiralis]KRZ37769.1 hypothetical protein T4C_7812 [Trichinella pseudospiralis]